MATKNNIVLDTSVIIKWFAKEENSDEALSYLEDFQNNKIIILIPSLLFYELGNAVVSKKGSISLASDIMQRLQKLSLDVKDIGLTSFHKIYQNSIEYSLTFYDATYIALAQETQCEFVTADKKLYQKLHKDFPLIKLI